MCANVTIYNNNNNISIIIKRMSVYTVVFIYSVTICVLQFVIYFNPHLITLLLWWLLLLLYCSFNRRLIKQLINYTYTYSSLQTFIYFSIIKPTTAKWTTYGKVCSRYGALLHGVDYTWMDVTYL